MLTGVKLGAAIAAAIKKKGVTQRDVAAHFGVKPPSIQDWIKRGTIGKGRLPDLWAYFAGVVGPEHWGLNSFPGSDFADPAQPTLAVAEPLKPYRVWPFEEIDIERWERLSFVQKGMVQKAMLDEIERIEARNQLKTGTGN